MRLNRFDDVYIALWSSPSEIRAHDEHNMLYLGGLTTFYDSLDELEKELDRIGVFQEWYVHLDTEHGETVDRNMPPAIAEFLIWLGTAVLAPGLAVTFYKILDLWVKKVNGRKIKVKFLGIEIETTQLTEKQFERLLQKIQEFTEKTEKGDIAKQLSGFEIKPIDDPSSKQEEAHLWHLQVTAQDELDQKGQHKQIAISDEGADTDQDDEYHDKSQDQI